MSNKSRKEKLMLYCLKYKKGVDSGKNIAKKVALALKKRVLFILISKVSLSGKISANIVASRK